MSTSSNNILIPQSSREHNNDPDMVYYEMMEMMKMKMKTNGNDIRNNSENFSSTWEPVWTRWDK